MVPILSEKLDTRPDFEKGGARLTPVRDFAAVVKSRV